MERFCDKCGSLVSGDGDFCPVCGARMTGVFMNNDHGVDLSKPRTGSAQNASNSAQFSVPQPSPMNNTYSGQSSYNQQAYPSQTYNNTQGQLMTVGQWVLTIFLSGLGLIGTVLLFVWAFDSSTNMAKKNYARAMLIFKAIALVLSFLLVPIFFGILVEIVDDLGMIFT